MQPHPSYDLSNELVCCTTNEKLKSCNPTGSWCMHYLLTIWLVHLWLYEIGFRIYLDQIGSGLPNFAWFAVPNWFIQIGNDDIFFMALHLKDFHISLLLQSLWWGGWCDNKPDNKSLLTILEMLNPWIRFAHQSLEFGNRPTVLLWIKKQDYNLNRIQDPFIMQI